VFDYLVRGPAPLSVAVKVALTVYGIILVPWIPVFTVMGSGMAFEGGYTFRAYAFVASAWAYPALVGVAFFLRRRRPRLVWLPVIALISILFF
jgi:hypothetical protein